MKTQARPPRCPVVFHAGITGHRDLSAADHVKLTATVAEVLAAVRESVETAVADLRRAPEPVIAADAPLFRLFTSLAAGADSLAAEEALKQGYQLQAPFPFPRAVYAGDFAGADKARWQHLTSQAAAVFELDGERRFANHGYLAAGRVVLDQCDVLIAIWDGEEARGVGGTEQIVEEAKERGLPVVVIDAKPPHAVRFLGTDRNGGTWRAALGREVKRILAPFDSADGSGFPWLYFRETRQVASQPPAIAAAMEWTDELAKRYAVRFRRAAVVRYFLAAVVIVGTFIGFYFEQGQQPWGFGLQTAVIFAILGLTGFINRAKWHQRMVDYRFLAEYLRHCATLSELGYVLPAARYPAYQAGEEAIWVNWYFRAVNRLRGLPENVIDTAKMTALRDTAVAEVTGQIEWYKAKAQRCARHTKILTALGLLAFVPGIIITVVRFAGFAVTIWQPFDMHVLPVDPSSLRRFLNEAALVLPALAPIFFGILSLAEYPRITRRYTAMAEHLSDVIEDLKHARPRRRDVLPQLVAITNVMLAEVSDWRVLIKARTLPRS